MKPASAAGLLNTATGNTNAIDVSTGHNRSTATTKSLQNTTGGNSTISSGGNKETRRGMGNVVDIGNVSCSNDEETAGDGTENKSNEFSKDMRLSKMTEENLQMKRKLQHYEANDAKRSSLGSVKLYSTGEMSSLTNGAIEPTKSIGLNMKVQKLLNAGMRDYIRAEMYSKIKFIVNDDIANKMTHFAVGKEFIQLPYGWKITKLRIHMKPFVYRAYSQVRHNLQSLARKNYIGKKIVIDCTVEDCQN